MDVSTKCPSSITKNRPPRPAGKENPIFWFKILEKNIAIFQNFFSAATEAACADKITWLPGLEKLPSFEMYSGYVHPTATKKLHYWFVQSQSNPSTDPVVVWFNGGPGCSSMEGFMAEHGPLHMNDDDTISMNPNAWNQKANMIYLEAPVGVGFSTGAPSDFDVISGRFSN